MKIEIYTKDNCVWCVRAKQLMNEKYMMYTEYKLGVDFTREELQAKIGENIRLTVPQIYVNGYRVGGYEEFVAYLEDHNVMGIQN